MPERATRAFTRRALQEHAVAFEVVDPWDGQVRKYGFELTGRREALERVPCGQRLLEEID